MEEDEDEEMVDASLKEPEKPVDPAEERKARGTEGELFDSRTGLPN